MLCFTDRAYLAGPVVWQGRSSSVPLSCRQFEFRSNGRTGSAFLQTRGEPKTQKRFINDTIRNDFHRKFLTRYIK